MAILEVEKLCKSFGGLIAIRELDVAVDEGEVLGLIGPNGSGKTTLFNLITGFLKPDSGMVKFKGQDITGLKPYRVCERGVAMTFQLAKPFSEMTALQNAMVGRLFGRNPTRSLKQAIADSREILDSVGLGHKSDVIANSLTLAQRKRLELARGLATRPQLLLLDELMSGLNPVETEAAIHLVQSVRDSGITVIMVEHVLRVVLGVCSRVVVMSYGEKIADGTPLEVTNNQKVIEAYLGSK